MEDQAELLRQRYHLYDSLKQSAHDAADMCALYTHAGLYDLAKERASEWSKYELDARTELNRLVDEGREWRDRTFGPLRGAQGPE